MSQTPETGAQQTGSDPVESQFVEGGAAASGSAASESPASESAAPGSEPAAEDDVRRRYREALERKRGRDAGAAGGRRRDGSGGVGPSSNAKSQRMFRRKSG
jgi:hypothetical protein